jgi:hypothetical protein
MLFLYGRYKQKTKEYIHLPLYINYIASIILLRDDRSDNTTIRYKTTDGYTLVPIRTTRIYINDIVIARVFNVFCRVFIYFWYKKSHHSKKITIGEKISHNTIAKESIIKGIAIQKITHIIITITENTISNISFRVSILLID